MRILKSKAVILVLLMLLCSLLSADKAVDKTEKVNELIKQGDLLYHQRAKLVNVNRAIAKYKEAIKLDPGSFDAMWRLSRVYYYYGTRVDEDFDDRRMEIFNEGKTWGMKAFELKPKRPEGHFWFGVNLGSWGEANGVLKSLSIRGDLEDSMKRVARIDESYEGAGAYRVLGRMKFRLPGLFGGDNDESISYLRKAVKLGPTNAMNYVFLAETLMDEDEYIEAEKLLKKCINMEPDPRWIPETKIDKKNARELLEEVREELED